MIAFGPIPSRRLGQSLGVNHLAWKACSYSCTYCQVGTSHLRAARRRFLAPTQVVDAVVRRVDACIAAGERIDYISFVPDGEPTLDANLGTCIRALLPLGIPVAVITNGSLLWMPEVREDLAAACIVSVKMDTTRADTWHRLNRAHGALDLDRVLEGCRLFAREFEGELVSDTMLVDGVNDDEPNVTGVANFLAEIAPSRSFVGVPTRPPASTGVSPASDAALERAGVIMKERLKNVVVLPTKEMGRFIRAGDPVEDLLGILAVHPMREAAARAYLADAGTDPALIDQLLLDGRVGRRQYQGEVFFVRGDGKSTAPAP
ncbi:MAG: radical SAM protein [Candidatus Krumholzibacteria bacterium]|nr:radical SAM protein [Candidatus Krumholzibacteria bacterium]